MLVLNDLKFLIPEIFLIIAMLGIFVYGCVISNVTVYRYSRVNKPVICLIILALIIYMYLVLHGVSSSFILGNFLFISDKFIVFLKIYFVFLIILILLVAY